MNNTEEQKYVWIPGELRTDTTENIVVSTDQVFDKEFPTLEEVNGKLTPSQTEIGEDQETINKYVRDKLNNISDKTPFIQNQNNGIQGQGGTAGGSNSFAIGNGTITSNPNEVAVGKFNKTGDGIVFSVGNGTSNNDRKNLFEIKSDGTITFYNEGNSSTLQQLLESAGLIVKSGDGMKSSFITNNPNTGEGALTLSDEGEAKNKWSLALGKGTKTTNAESKFGELAIGRYNKSDEETYFSIGIGIDDNSRANLFEIRYGGSEASDNGVYYLGNKINSNGDISQDDIDNIVNQLKNFIPIIQNGVGIEVSKDSNRYTISTKLFSDQESNRTLGNSENYYPVEVDSEGRLAVYVADNVQRVAVNVSGDTTLRNKIKINFHYYDNDDQQFVDEEVSWTGSQVVKDIPYSNQNYTISITNIPSGYFCVNSSDSGTPNSPNANYIFTVSKAQLTVNRSSNQNNSTDPLPASTATLSWTENGTNKSKTVNFTQGQTSVGVEGIPLGTPITITFADITGYTTPSLIQYTYSQSNLDSTSGVYNSCKVTFNPTSNQSSDNLPDELQVTIKYNNQNYTISKGKSKMFPLNSEINVIEYSGVSGYTTPQANQQITLSNSSETLNPTYSTTKISVTITGQTGLQVEIWSDSTTKQTYNNSPIKIPTGDQVSYKISNIPAGKNYTSNLQSGFTATGLSQNIQIIFSDIQTANFIVDVQSNLGGEYTTELQNFAYVKILQYEENAETGLQFGGRLYRNGDNVTLPITYGENKKYRYNYSYTSPNSINGETGQQLSFSCTRPTPSELFTPQAGVTYYSSDWINSRTLEVSKGVCKYKSMIYNVRFLDSTASFQGKIKITPQYTIKQGELGDDPTVDESDLGGHSATDKHLVEEEGKVWNGNDLTFIGVNPGYVTLSNLEQGELDLNFILSYTTIDPETGNPKEFDHAYKTEKEIVTTDGKYECNVTISIGKKLEGIFPIFNDGRIYVGENTGVYRNNQNDVIGMIVYRPSQNMNFIIPKDDINKIIDSSDFPKRMYFNPIFNAPLMEKFTPETGEPGDDAQIPNKVAVHPNQGISSDSTLNFTVSNLSGDIGNNLTLGVSNTFRTFKSLTDDEKTKSGNMDRDLNLKVGNLLASGVYKYDDDVDGDCHSNSSKFTKIAVQKQLYQKLCDETTYHQAIDYIKISPFNAGYVKSSDADYEQYMYPKGATRKLKQIDGKYVEVLKWDKDTIKVIPYIGTVCDWKFVMDNIQTITDLGETHYVNLNDAPLKGLKNKTEKFYTCQVPQSGWDSTVYVADMNATNHFTEVDPTKSAPEIGLKTFLYSNNSW